MLRLGLPRARIPGSRFYAVSKVPFSAKIAALVAKTGPEQIYVYTPSRLVKLGSWTLAGVFAVYGVSFADWSLSSALELYHEERSSAPPESWWKHPTLLLLARTAGSLLLSIIPLTLSALAIYVPSRIATGVTYLPNGACQLTRRAMFSGKPVSRIRPLNTIVRNQKTKVYTGVGPQGTEDKGSFAFLLTDTQRPSWDRFYVVNRSGKFWGQDGRVFDALFGGDSVKSLERFSEASSTSVDDSNSLQKLILEQQGRPKLNEHSIKAKDIVMKRK
ncbi:LANO_0A01090g1_1 [Lachancea nothofagi CBS 11611]|uniref:LANO_0A01090g1_1 n=1 Tax=Lachancea nothofagi CBS 11611 TaxID=1266666 RepID=A0A1G4IM66_9SACH|nr:LANO_0A01090g1_1 [Lachancea nothofagi CBS 11611]